MRDPYRAPDPWSDVKYGSVNKNNCNEYGQFWMRKLAVQQDRMRRAADALEGCIGVLITRAR
eukprot:3690694-Lingulodinium_polyedra.AAC.1